MPHGVRFALVQPGLRPPQQRLQRLQEGLLWFSSRAAALVDSTGGAAALRAQEEREKRKTRENASGFVCLFIYLLLLITQ